jgi:hypothetical protein
MYVLYKKNVFLHFICTTVIEFSKAQPTDNLAALLSENALGV